ncbi:MULTISPECIES: phospholipase A [Vibrio]|uniref:Phospholipase A1 n=2 Tax=Vibrio TaxID=662 RepID=A0A7X4RWH6_9VIBR|nr:MULTISPECIES: phospholipase A [Vibrio]MBF9001332.1 phospholipase A [Vibrio nitrifigilis]MZI95901.1 phospholipase [Vibrio eleionomae]
MKVSLTILLLSYIVSSAVYAADTTTNDTDDSLVDERTKEEHKVMDNPFVIMPHKANYLLPVTYNPHPNNKPFRDDDEYADSLDNFEAKFQISFKMPLAIDLVGDGDLYFAYTNQSWWQVYNKDSSAPFRETVHEPELFLLFDNDWEVAGFKNSYWMVGADHQSNGRSSTLSRSWNRLYGSMIFDKGPLALSTKVWWRIPESEKSSPTDATGDDNPDITHYMGNFELTGLYGVGEQRYSFMFRNNLEKHNRAALELTWSYPIHRNLRAYVQYFNGYGESLIDYNVHTQRIGVGIALNDLL